jgi:putative ABC transport system ATP-binding protein
MPHLTLNNFRAHDVGPLELEISAGECLALTGASGAGKTILLRAIADLDPHGGDARLGDAACASMPAPEWRRRVGYLPPEPCWWRATVGEHFAAEARSALVERLGFPEDAWSWQVGRLSSGETQRLALARLLEGEPRALLLDEPTAHLDDEWTHVVESIVSEYRTAHDAPVLWVSHDVGQVSRVASRHLVLADGELVPAERHADPAIREPEPAGGAAGAPQR